MAAKKKKKKPNKQRTSRGSSFARIAEDIRTNTHDTMSPATLAGVIADAHENEAKRLRRMR